MKIVALYNDNPGETCTKAGESLRVEFARLIEPFLESAKKQNFSMRHVRDLLQAEISLQCSCVCLTRAVEDHTSEKKARKKNG